MRRRDKQIVQGVLWGASISAVGDVLLQWYGSKMRGEKFTWDKFDGWRTFKISMIGGTLGGIIGYASYSSQLEKEAEHPFSSDSYLKGILYDENLKSDSKLFKNVLVERDRVKRFLWQTFNGKFASYPEDTGSFRKRTAIGSNYDLDIILPFKKNSYKTLKLMYEQVYVALSDRYGERAIIDRRTRVIGITINMGNSKFKIDIVPGREIGNYQIDKKLKLYVKPDWFWQNGSSFKINVGSQKNIAVNKPEARSVIKLLKSYRDRNELPLPSSVVDQCVVEALSENNYGTTSSETENLLNSMEYISDKIESGCVTDIANSNNNLLDKVNDFEKNILSSQIRDDVKKIEENPRYLKEVFE